MDTDTSTAADAAQIIVLSAPDTDALRGKARLLLAQLHALARHAATAIAGTATANDDAGDGPSTLAALAYTLQSSPDEGACRTAFVVSHVDDLVGGLEHYLRALSAAQSAAPRAVVAGRRGVLVPVFCGDIGVNAAAAQLLAGAAAARMARALWAARDLENLALFWVRGGRVDWDALHDGPRPRPRRLMLPDVVLPTNAARADDTGISFDPPSALAPEAAPMRTATEVEALLGQLWQSLFGLPTVGRHQDFFELGGDSLLGMRMLVLLRELHGIDLLLRHVYEAPTIARLGETIMRLAAVATASENDDAIEYEEGFIR